MNDTFSNDDKQLSTLATAEGQTTVTNECSEILTRTAATVSEVVKNGLCIGCGLCEAVTSGKVSMQMTEHGSLRPYPLDGFTPHEEAVIMSACPGVEVEARVLPSKQNDLVWGSFDEMRYAWASDPQQRYVGATGGVLTALGSHLLKSGRAKFILHVGPDPAKPIRNTWVISETVSSLLANAGSRYAPVSPLAGLDKALSRREPFAIIAKPCDFSALHRLGKSDDRVEQFCIARLAMVCGGQSRLGKTQALLSDLNVAEEDVSLIRYRGHGNPGKTRVETKQGAAFERTYLEMWQDENGWEIETRCKLCPDALGEACDVVAADVWPGCNPSVEDEGYNGIVIRTPLGSQLVADAAAGGDLTVGSPITPRQFDDFQPHQVRKKRVLMARFSGLRKAGKPVIKAQGLRLQELAYLAPSSELEEEEAGTLRRALEGKIF